MNRNTQTIAYWTSTAIVAFVMIGGGAGFLMRLKAGVAGIVALGYPVYFMNILGFWKVLAGVAILAPRFPRLKEWAYAGIVFDLTGAFASHLISGSGAKRLAGTGFFTLLALVSWALRPPGRVLGKLFPSGLLRREELSTNRATTQPQPVA